MRRLLELLLVVVVVACGGRIDDGGTDASVDAGVDAKSDAVVKPDTSPPQCTADLLPCKTDAQCCSGVCFQGTCGAPPPPPPPPPCEPDGTACSSDSECCSNVCNGTCGVQIACATTSNKKCDLCVAANCCKPYVDCNNDAACAKWLGCVESCEQQGQSAFTCSQAQGSCGVPPDTAASALYKCAQGSCGNPCAVD